MKSAWQGFGHLLSGSVVGRFAGAVANIALGRTLNITAFGSFSLYLQLIQTAEMLSRCGLDYSLVYWTSQDSEFKQDSSKQIAQTALQLGVFFSVVTVSAFAFYILWPHLQFPWPLSSPWLPLIKAAVLGAIACECCASILWDIKLVQRRTKQVSLRIGLFGPLKIIAATLGGSLFNLEGAITGWLLGSCLQLIWLGRTTPLFGFIKILPKSIWLASTSKLLSKGLPFYASNFAGQLVFLPLLLSLSSAAGVQSIGLLRVGQICAQIFGVLSGALVPILFLSLRSESNSAARANIINQCLSASWSVSLIIFAILCMADASLIGWGFGSSYLQGIPATRVLVACVIMDSLAQILQQSLLAEGKVRSISVSQNLTALISALIGWKTIPWLGLNGYLTSRLFYSIVPMLATILLARRLHPSLQINKRLISGSIIMAGIILDTLVRTGLTDSKLVTFFLLTALGLALSCLLEQGWLRPRT